MEDLSFTTSILVDQTPKEVFDAITNVKNWWQGEIDGSSNRIGDEFTYRMKDMHYSAQRVIEFRPNEKLVWEVIDSSLSSFHDKTEWTGTKIIFEIKEEGSKTKVIFTHKGLLPTFECYGGCSWGWGALLRESLYSLITTGKGKNVFG